MGTFSDRFSLFLPNKQKYKREEDVDYGENWRNLERWANVSGLVSWLAPLASSVLNGWSKPVAPIDTKLFVQAEGFKNVTFVGGSGTITFPVAFPNGVISALCQYDVSLGAGVIAIARVIATTSTTLTVQLHTQAAGVTAYIANSDQRISYIAIGW